MSENKLRVNVLGCGTSTGVPLIHCSCAVCTSSDPRNKRLRASILVTVNGKNILIDTSPDFRQQALRAKIPRIDAILYTHPHFDHIAGIDEIRSFNFVQKETIPAFAHPWTFQDLHQRYAYIFSPSSYGGKVEGGGAASICLKEFQLTDSEFTAAGIKIIPIALDHGSQAIAGFRIGNLAYLTDCNHIPEASFERLQGLEVLILDCLRLSKHDTHLNLEGALQYSARIQAKTTYFTHLSHDFDYENASRNLPKNHALAYDEMIITLGE